MILTNSSAYDAPYGFFGDNIMQGSKENIVNILLLAGASKKNISWIMKLRDELLEIQKYSVSVFNYTHWKDGGEIDTSEEAKKLYPAERYMDLDARKIKKLGWHAKYTLEEMFSRMMEVHCGDCC